MSIEVIKQLVDALENAKHGIAEEWHDHYLSEAIKAGRQAIEQADQKQPSHTDHPMRHWDRTCPACIAEQEQEPVAWMHTKIDDVVVSHRPADLDKHPDRWESLYRTPPPCPTCEALARTVMMDQTAHDFYTTPQPQREWVGLTDEDLSVCDDDGVVLARYWEAKLKEKNGG